MNRYREANAVAKLLALIGFAAGAYEAVAVWTNGVPTISEVLWATPVWSRVVIITLAVAASVDHFITRRWL